MVAVQVLLSSRCAPCKMRNVSLCRAEKSELSLFGGNEVESGWLERWITTNA